VKPFRSLPLALCLTLPLWAEGKVFITFQPLRGWKPRITLEEKVGENRLKLDYKLFGDRTKVKVKLFKSLSAGLELKGFNPKGWNVRTKIDPKLRAVAEILLSGERVAVESPANGKKPILCTYGGEKNFCPLEVSGTKEVIPIGGSFSDFTLVLKGIPQKKECHLLRLESFPGFPWLEVELKEGKLTLKVGDKRLTVPFVGENLKVALVKEKDNLSIFLGEDTVYSLSVPPRVYLHRAVLERGCLRHREFLLYPTAKGKETLLLTLLED